MLSAFKKLTSFIVDVLYPRSCIRCGRWGEYLCDQCHTYLNFTLEDNLVPTLFANSTTPVYLQRLQAAIVYDDLARRLLHNYKYLGVRELDEYFAHWLYEYTTCIRDIDVITFIPIHRRRFRERGYNQARLVATKLAALSGLPCVPLLARPVYREKQDLSHSKAERLTKTQNIFAAMPTTIPTTTRILIVDDVVTSGATLNEAARVLHAAGFAQVSAVAIAHGD